jgi:hypothetical protein
MPPTRAVFSDDVHGGCDENARASLTRSHAHHARTHHARTHHACTHTHTHRTWATDGSKGTGVMRATRCVLQHATRNTLRAAGLREHATATCRLPNYYAEGVLV